MPDHTFFYKESCVVYDLGRIAYTNAYALQHALHQLIGTMQHDHALLLLEHDPVITIGKSGQDHDILLTKETLDKEKIPVINIDRGGQVTFHGPGQLVGYVLFYIRKKLKHIRKFMEGLETSLIATLAGYDIPAKSKASHPGIWIQDRKIASVGISIHNGVSLHGFALNVSTDLRYFRYIVPCGLSHTQITSMLVESKEHFSMQKVKHRYIQEMQRVFGFASCTIKTLPQSLAHLVAREQNDENALSSSHSHQ